jgi:AcrR family transcriptional regulator
VNTKMDRRKKYTRMVLKDSLMQLLKEKPISAITVKELCELADINRSTFYSHYGDHYDLLSKIEEEIIEDMQEKLQMFNMWTEELIPIEMILEYIVDKKDVFLVLLKENGENNLHKRVRNLAHGFLVSHLMRMHNIEKDKIEYLSLFIVSGSIQMIISWLDHGMDKSEKELAGMINTFANKGLLGVESL